MAEADSGRVQIEVGFDGGQIMIARVSPQTVDELEHALAGGRINWWIVGGCAALLVLGAVLVKRWFARMAHRMNGEDPAAR